MDDNYYMNLALQEAHNAYLENEVPIGAIVVDISSNGVTKIIAKGHNSVEKLNDITAHAEIIALTSAFAYRKSKYLPNSKIYITLEPCPMCAYAMHMAQLGSIVYGADDLIKGYSNFSPSLLHNKTFVKKGIKAAACSQIITSFFRDLRRKTCYKKNR